MSNLNCTEGCGFSHGNPTAVENLNRVHEIMAPIVDSGLPLQAVKPMKGYWLAPFLFEIAEIEGNAYLRLKSGIINGDSFIEVKVDPVDCSVVWYEQGIASGETELVAQLDAGDLVVEVEDVSVLGNLSDSHTIILTAGAQVFTGRVDSVDAVANTITLKAWPSIDIPEGTCVSRGTYHRPQDCVTESDNEWVIGYDKGKYKSYFRKIEATVSFDANTDCTLSSYTYAEDLGLETSVEFLKVKKSAAIVELNRQLHYAIFYDQNYAKNTNPAFPNSSETMGIFPRLDFVQNDMGIVTTFDFAAECCTDFAECDAISNSINTFFDYIDYVTKSGFYGSKVVIGVNEAQIVALRNMRPYFEAHAGYVVTTSPAASGQIFIDRQIFNINTGVNEIEFRYEPSFDRYKIPFMFVMPENSMLFVQKEYNTVEFNGTDFKAKKHDTSSLMPWMPIFRVLDLTSYQTNGIDPCKIYHIDAEIAIVRPFTDKAAYIRLWNFGSCLPASCATCVSDSMANAGTGKVQMITEAN